MKQKQTAKLLDYLIKGNHITQEDALKMFSIGRLASRIHDLKQPPYNKVIGKRMIPVINQLGQRVKVAEYWLVKVGLIGFHQGI